MPSAENSAAPQERIRGFEQAFRRENARLVLERARQLLWIALVLYPLFWLLDVAVQPELALRFLVVRLVVCLLYVGGLLIVYSPVGQKNAEWVIFVGALASSAGISMMAAWLGGFESNYFAGNMIVIFVLGFFMPWSLRITTAFCVLAIFLYIVLVTADHGVSRMMVGPLFFLVGTAIFTYLATLSAVRTRRRDLSLRLRLERANESLQELDEVKTRFFANVSHELRTPLTLLLGPLETLLAEVHDADIRSLLESMAKNARRLLRQVDALLDVAKLEAGRLVLDLEEEDLGTLLEDLVDATRPHAEGRGVELATVGLESLSSFPFDRDKVEVIAANLLSNAVKFTPAGGKISMRAEIAGDDVVFEVEDSGPGIPPEEQEVIFDRFHQVDDALSREQGGTGLGLALSRELARLHGGDCTVVSELGRGSTFRVRLPLEPTGPARERRRKFRRKEDRMAQMLAESLTASAYAARTKRSTLLADVAGPSIGSRRERAQPAPRDAPCVLLVEDNPDLRSFLAEELVGEYRVETAADGVEGLEKARTVRPNLIVSDIMMPRMNGVELCRHLRADPRLQAVPIILVTAKTGEEAVVEGLELGADDYVVKPFAFRELKARIAAHLRAKEMERRLHERESRLAAIGQMTGSVLGELRGPLTLVKGYADLARAMAGDERQRDRLAEELDKLHEATDRLRRMVAELVEFSHSGSTELQATPTPVNKFLQHHMGSYATTLEREGVKLELDFEVGERTTALLDQEALRSTLDCLITNAREALAGFQGEKRIRVQARQYEQSLVIRVADSGPGIADDLARRLLRPEVATSKSYGTGLGLQTVRNLVKAHGGEAELEARSREGGAAVTFRVPLKSVGGDEPPPTGEIG